MGVLVAGFVEQEAARLRDGQRAGGRGDGGGAALGVPVDRVWAGGRRVVENGRHVRRGPIEARFRRAMTELMAAS